VILSRNFPNQNANKKWPTWSDLTRVKNFWHRPITNKDSLKKKKRSSKYSNMNYKKQSRKSNLFKRLTPPWAKQVEKIKISTRVQIKEQHVFLHLSPQTPPSVLKLESWNFAYRLMTLMQKKVEGEIFWNFVLGLNYVFCSIWTDGWHAAPLDVYLRTR